MRKVTVQSPFKPANKPPADNTAAVFRALANPQTAERVNQRFGPGTAGAARFAPGAQPANTASDVYAPPGQQQYAPGQGFTPGPPTPTPFPANPAEMDPGYASAPPPNIQWRGGNELPPHPQGGFQQNGPFGPGVYEPAGAQPANTVQGQAPQAPPPRGTRISPGIYADGRGGTYRALGG